MKIDFHHHLVPLTIINHEKKHDESPFITIAVATTRVCLSRQVKRERQATADPTREAVFSRGYAMVSP